MAPLGTDKVVDYTKEDFAQSGDTYDLIFDTVGKSSYAHCRKALKSNGKYVVTVMSLKLVFQSFLTRFGNKKKVIFAMSLNKTEGLNFIRILIEESYL